jgi:hypothetical protein
MKRQRMKLEPEIKPSPLVGRPIISPRLGERDAALYNNRYQFCGVLGKKMKRMNAILSERNKVANV